MRLKKYVFLQNTTIETINEFADVGYRVIYTYTSPYNSDGDLSLSVMLELKEVGYEKE